MLWTLLLFVLAGAAAAEESQVPPWARSITSLTGTLPAVSSAPMENPLDPVAALRSLDAPDASTGATPAFAVSSFFKLEPDPALATNLDQRIESARVAKLTEEADRLYREGNWESAVSNLASALPGLQFKPNRSRVLNRLGYLYSRRNRYEEAIEFLQQAYTLDKNDIRAVCNLAGTLLNAGRYEEADDLLVGANITRVRDPVLLFSIFFNSACAKSMRGQIEPAFLQLARAAQADPISAWTAIGDPQLDPLRADPRFQSLRASLESYYDQRVRKKEPDPTDP